MKYFKKIDCFSCKVSLTINDKGEISKKTIKGGILSLIFILLSLFCSLYFSYRMLKRLDLSVIHSTEMNPFINLTYSNKLPFLLRLSDTNSIPYENDEKLYYITSNIWYGGSNNSLMIGNTPQHSEKLNISKCNLNTDFDDEFKIYFEKFEILNSYYCLKPRNYNQTIYGLYGNYNPFSYYSFTLRYCDNNTQNNNSCYSIDQIKNKIISPYLDVIFIDYTLDSIHQHVQKISLRQERYELSLKLYKRIWLYLENIKYITDNGYIFTNNKIENFHTYDMVRIDPSLLSENSDYFATLSLMNSKRSSIYYKKYTKFQDYIAIIGGFIKVISICGTILNYFSSKNSYYINLIQNFFVDNNYNIQKNSLSRINSSMLIKSKTNFNINTNFSKNESGINYLNKKQNIIKIGTFNKFKSLFSNKIFPLFANKKLKIKFNLLKEKINQRLNINNILKKLELIQIPLPDFKKQNLLPISHDIFQIKNLNLKLNNYINDN